MQLTPFERIWPFGYFLCIFPYDVIFAEDEKGTVDSKTVLFDRDWVIYGHCPGSLGH